MKHPSRENPKKSSRRAAVNAESRKRWSKWLEGEGSVLTSTGLPTVVYETEDNWRDFLANGTLHVHGGMLNTFSFQTMPTKDLQRLTMFLKSYLEEWEYAKSGLVYAISDELDRRH